MARVRTHPGEILREEYLAPLGMSSHELADALEVPANRISEIVREARSVTADTALRLAEHFNTTPEFWLNAQMAYDLSKARAAAEAAAPARRYYTATNEVRHAEPKVTRSSVTGKFSAKIAGKTLRETKDVAASSLSQRSRRTSSKPTASKPDSPKHKK